LAASLGSPEPFAALLFGLGIFSLVRHHHPRWVRMQVGFCDLTVWSFLMASAHGADLMLLPVLLGSRTAEAADHMAGQHHMSAAAALCLHCSPPRYILLPILLSLGSSHGWSIGLVSRFFARPGSISTWYGLLRSL
jgi:hypothetical protein